MQRAATLHRLLGDDTRLRMLRLLRAERLNVTELTGVLGVAQSGVSRHLGLLKEAGLVTEQREGGFTYYGLFPPSAAPDQQALWTLLDAEFEAAHGDPTVRADLARLQEVLRLRQENFETHGGGEGEARQLVPGRSWAAWARALGHLLPPLDVADLGCGEGFLTLEAAAWARRVVAIDRSREVLSKAKALARRRHLSNVTWKRGEIERVPLRSGSVDVALLSQALHHAADPAKAVAEAARILRPGGRLLILDLRSHDQAWVQDRLGDRWLGFDNDRLETWMRQAGLDDIRAGVGARRIGDPFVVIVASGARPLAPTRTRRRP